jgi:hypothetical protein
MEVEEQSFKKAKDLVEFLISDSVLAPETRFDLDNVAATRYIFRGQADSNWKLLPTVHRSTNCLSQFTPQPPESEIGDSNEYLAMHMHAELRSVHLFLTAADREGLVTPLDYANVALHLRDMQDLLHPEKTADLTRAFPDERLLPSVALAQHHGVPTRLLDWSESPWVAAYFAAYAAMNSSNSDCKKENKRISITCLGMDLVHNNKDLNVISCQRAHNSNLRAQKGLFSLIPTANEYFNIHNKWPSIEDIITADTSPKMLYMKPQLIKLFLPASESKDLLKRLFRLGFHRMSLMPSLQNAALHESYKQMLFG